MKSRILMERLLVVEFANESNLENRMTKND